MLGTKRFLIVFIMLLPALLSAQIISMDFPKFVGKSYMFLLFQGGEIIKEEGTIPESGKFVLKVPENLFPYEGMARWLLTNSETGGGLDLMITGKDFSVKCNESMPDESNIVYSKDTEKLDFDELYKQQQGIIMRYNAMKQAVNSFTKTDENYLLFDEEFKKQQLAYNSFQQTLKQHPGYAKKFLSIVNTTLGVGTEVYDDERQRAENIAAYIAGGMDWKSLFTSGHWTTVISIWIEIHTEVIKDRERFVKDFIWIGNTLENPMMYRDFVGKVAYYLTKKGKDDLISELSPYVDASKIDQYEGSLAAYIKGNTNTTAPDLVFIEHIGNISDHNHKTSSVKSSALASVDHDKTLLLFYDSGCGHCDGVLQELKVKYKELDSKGVQIISISADKDKDVFKTKAKDFLWKYAYCDYDGIQGINFKNYGVIGTPTLVLIDRNGKILTKTSDLNKVMEYVK